MRSFMLEPVASTGGCASLAREDMEARSLSEDLKPVKILHRPGYGHPICCGCVLFSPSISLRGVPGSGGEGWTWEAL